MRLSELATTTLAGGRPPAARASTLRSPSVRPHAVCYLSHNLSPRACQNHAFAASSSRRRARPSLSSPHPPAHLPPLGLSQRAFAEKSKPFSRTPPRSRSSPPALLPIFLARPPAPPPLSSPPPAPPSPPRSPLRHLPPLSPPPAPPQLTPPSDSSPREVPTYCLAGRTEVPFQIGAATLTACSRNHATGTTAV
ncbi:hypothetical protein GOBAR_AA05378 [Gossypium barbadense]|uniref:Uncharacterized protein n=1 Tax=Gossypium barbadense TaxID=3634 RepID=A0A2P5YI00_GOSBA|nr:hypothetical protein GOBAR_AA05378 [Gossypium barbadense]